MTTQNDDELIQAARLLLDESAERVSYKVKTRLQLAREQALSARRVQSAVLQTSGNMGFEAPAWLGPLSTSSVFASVILIFALIWLNPITDTMRQTSGLEDIEIIASANDWELYQDLDFYVWLSDETPD